MARKATKPKRGFTEGYRTYNPVAEGYGNPEEWQKAFNVRMGVDEANKVIDGRNPRSILGVASDAGWPDIKSAYRNLAMQYHPDRVVSTGLDPKVAEDRLRVVIAAYTVLAEEFGKD